MRRRRTGRGPGPRPAGVAGTRPAGGAGTRPAGDPLEPSAGELITQGDGDGKVWYHDKFVMVNKPYMNLTEKKVRENYVTLMRTACRQ